jgi:hypothetical protein
MGIRTSPNQAARLALELGKANAAWNETLWTVLAADLVSRDLTCLRQLVGEVAAESSPDVWLEGRPLPPRKGSLGATEGSSRVDLSIGGITGRGSTDAGIAYDGIGAWSCFVEAKLLSDCDTCVEHDPLRNQLTRVIESLLCFQSADGRLPAKLIFSLLTPRLFQEKGRRSRLFGYKMAEYEDRVAILHDIKLSALAPRSDVRWRYPALEERLSRLDLRWITFEDIFAGDPTLGGIDVATIAQEGRLPDEIFERMEVVIANINQTT